LLALLLLALLSLLPLLAANVSKKVSCAGGAAGLAKERVASKRVRHGERSNSRGSNDGTIAEAIVSIDNKEEGMDFEAEEDRQIIHQSCARQKAAAAATTTPSS
jgi:hypothetical protein